MFVCLFVFVEEEKKKNEERENEGVLVGLVVELVFYLMASHMSRPIFTQFLAWFGSDSGSPDTQ